MSDVGHRTPDQGAPRWLLWSGGALAALLCVAVFLIWGFHGPSMLFDMIVALCM